MEGLICNSAICFQYKLIEVNSLKNILSLSVRNCTTLIDFIERGNLIMEYGSRNSKIRVTRIGSGIRLADDRYSENVCTSKNRCILGFVADGKQILMNERELVRDFKNLDGSDISPHRIVAGKVNIVEYRCGEFELARAT